MKIDTPLKLQDLRKPLRRFFELAVQKITALDRRWDPAQGTPVFTVDGAYTTRGWTEWTQGFQFGCALLAFDATGERRMLKLGRQRTIERMAPHVTHVGVHDHGFNNVSTYGNLRRLARESRFACSDGEMRFYEMALKASGAVQAARWSRIADGTGYIHSFNGPHSLFVDTIRTVRALMVSHDLGHVLMGENDQPHNLLHRGVQHIVNTLKYNVYYGEGRDAFDVPGRTCHEAVFNMTDGNFRCPSTQQGYSPFSTWTRGLAWAMLGCAEELQFLATLPDRVDLGGPTRKQFAAMLLRAARATADFYIANTSADGIPVWDTGAPGVAAMGDYTAAPADPYNDHEPYDSSAAAITAQGLIRLGDYLAKAGRKKQAARYTQAGLTTAAALLDEPFLSTKARHQGLILHSIYHRPNGWDHVPPGRTVPCGESSMWGDYHAMELAVLLQRKLDRKPYLTFFA